MARGLLTSLAQDFSSSARLTTSTTSTSLIFTPADGVQTGLKGNPSSLISAEVIIHNTDATIGVWVRWALPVNETVSQGLGYVIAGVGAAGSNTGPQQQGSMPLSVDVTKFVAATLGTRGETFVPPATQYAIRILAIGLTIIAVAGTPIVNVIAVGAMHVV